MFLRGKSSGKACKEHPLSTGSRSFQRPNAPDIVGKPKRVFCCPLARPIEFRTLLDHFVVSLWFSVSPGPSRSNKCFLPNSSCVCGFAAAPTPTNPIQRSDVPSEPPKARANPVHELCVVVVVVVEVCILYTSTHLTHIIDLYMGGAPLIWMVMAMVMVMLNRNGTRNDKRIVIPSNCRSAGVARV